MSTFAQIAKELKKLSNPAKAKILQRFFKTAPGQYGAGDIFLGITVPEIRNVAKKRQDANAQLLKELLRSKIHEFRLCALEILVLQYEKTGLQSSRRKIFNFYVRNKKYINNWDLVDLSASYIVGDYLKDKSKALLYKLAKSKNIWDRRISIISTANFISQKSYADALKISKILISDKEDLIHKAVGWMLREVGKRDLKTEMDFLDIYAHKMPRTMLRYAIERFPEKARKKYLKQ